MNCHACQRTPCICDDEEPGVWDRPEQTQSAGFAAAYDWAPGGEVRHTSIPLSPDPRPPVVLGYVTDAGYRFREWTCGTCQEVWAGQVGDDAGLEPAPCPSCNVEPE